jgi:glucose/arabinose dehydrogenase
MLSISFLFLICNNSFITAVKDIKDSDLKAQLVVKGLNRPTSMVFLSQNEILVAQQMGKVQRIEVNDILHPYKLDHKSTVNSTALDLTPILNSTGERGILGIEISQDKQTGENENYPNGLKVYLLYTRSVNDIDLDKIKCLQRICDSNGSFVHSVYLYEYRNGKLVNPKLLFNVPLYSNESIQHIGGKITINPENNKLYFTSGDGRGCEYDDCILKSANMLDSSGSKTVGGIYYYSTEGGKEGNYNVTSNNTFQQFAYGIRNSYGLDFDPITGNLWDTENGPTFGDELNLVKPGFNSGWPQVQGIWPIRNYGELANNPSPGLPKGYLSEDSQKYGTIDNITNFNGKGNYSQPEFTWNQTVGVTAIKFFNSDKMGKEYENDMFVGTYKGDIYHFDLNKERNGLALKGELEDKVANNDDELRGVIFSQDLSSGIGVTDLEIGPDGYLYVLSYSTPGGAIFRIVPK